MNGFFMGFYFGVNGVFIGKQIDLSKNQLYFCHKFEKSSSIKDYNEAQQ